MSSSRFTVATWNIQHNGTDADGSDHRWHLAMDILRQLKPNVLLRQEVKNGRSDGRRKIFEEAARLGGAGPAFHAFDADPTAESPNAAAVYVDPDLFTPLHDYQHSTGLWHPICNPVVQLKDAVVPLSLASVHLCHFDPGMRAFEANRLTFLGRPNMATILGGDFNSYPHRTEDEIVKLPDWSRISDRSHFQHRTVKQAGTRVSDTQPDEILAGEHDGHPPIFRELGHYAAVELARGHGPLAPTASLWNTDQGPMRRIDRLYATPQVAAALTSLEVIDDADVREVSDHAPVVATFDLQKLRRALSPDATTAAT